MIRVEPALISDVTAPVWIVLLAVGGVTLFCCYRSVTLVSAFETYVFVDDGAVTRVLDPGIHVTSPFRSPDRRIEMRTQPLTLRVEPRTDDWIDLEVDVTGSVRVADAATVATMGDYHDTLEDRTARAIKRECERRTWEEIRADRDAIERRCEERLAREFEESGIELRAFAIERIERRQRR